MRHLPAALAAAVPTALLAAVVTAVLLTGNAGCANAAGSSSCLEYYEKNVPGITPAERDVCLIQQSKQDGLCCVAGSQCQSGVCCGWDQTCGARQECECVGP